MVAYYGSIYYIDNLSMYTQQGEHLLLTTDIDVASSYGGYVYTLDLDNIVDLTSTDSVATIVTRIMNHLSSHGIKIPALDTKDLIEYLTNGYIPFNYLHAHLYNLLIATPCDMDYSLAYQHIYTACNAHIPKVYLSSDTYMGTLITCTDASKVKILNCVKL